MRWVFVNTTPTPPTAQNDAVDFAPLDGARQLLLTTTSKAVTPFAGLASFIAWLRQIGFLDQAIEAAEAGDKTTMNAKIANAIFDIKQRMNNAN